MSCIAYPAKAFSNKSNSLDGLPQTKQNQSLCDLSYLLKLHLNFRFIRWPSTYGSHPLRQWISPSNSCSRSRVRIRKVRRSFSNKVFSEHRTQKKKPTKLGLANSFAAMFLLLATLTPATIRKYFLAILISFLCLCRALVSRKKMNKGRSRSRSNRTHLSSVLCAEPSLCAPVDFEILLYLFNSLHASRHRR